jgi:FixJ family two-component response regulator
MADKILFVDDEPAVLEGYRRVLYPEFAVDIVDSAAKAFVAMEENGPYSVVISDMRMPIMNGAEFLSKIRNSTPDTVRMLFTGYTDIGPAIEAVNKGSIFRFLTKPCEPAVLATAIADGIKQYQLITGEKELLEKTLMGSIKVLTEVLAAANPEAFGRSMRIAHYARHISKKVNLPSPWCVEVAATLSQLGCITLEADLMLRGFSGAKLTANEQAEFSAHPIAATELLKNIPRLEPAAWMIAQQLKADIPATELEFPGFAAADLLLGAKILKLAVAFEQTRAEFPAKGAALMQLRERNHEFEPSLLDTLVDLQPHGCPKQLLRVSTSKLRAGMILDQEIKNGQGVLLVAKGQELTVALIMRLENHAKAGSIDKEVMAFVSE